MTPAARALCLIVLLAPLPAAAGDETARALLFAPEGNRLRVLDLGVEDVASSQWILIESAEAGGPHDRDINGMVCALPDRSGRFVAGEDTGQPQRPAGWGVFDAAGRQVGKLAATSYARQPEPFGCAFDRQGRLFTTDIGDPGFDGGNGQLIVWFPPFDRSPAADDVAAGARAYSADHCKLAIDLGTPGEIEIDAQGRVLVATSSGLEILRFSPPFPTGPDAAGGCGRRDPLGAPLADAVQREVFAGPLWSEALLTYSGLAAAPNGHFYVSSVFTGRIAELDGDGALVRMILAPDDWLPVPPFATGTPQSLAVGPDGALYYADLDLVWEGWMPGPGPDGKLWRIRFGPDGTPLPPEPILTGLAFPDGVAVLAAPPTPATPPE